MSNPDKTTPNIGQLLAGGEARDAIHIAVAPVEAVEALQPGDCITLVEDPGNTGHMLVKKAIHGLGIADPFLSRTIDPGDRFYMFLHPGSISSLRHEWSHPKFREESRRPGAVASIYWLTNFAESNGMTYEQVILAAKNYEECGDYLCLNFSPDLDCKADEFWRHIEKVTGIAFDENGRPLPFSCSC